MYEKIIVIVITLIFLSIAYSIISKLVLKGLKFKRLIGLIIKIFTGGM